MTCELITGCSGSAHVSSADDGSMFASVIGRGRFAVNQGGNLAASLEDSNTVLLQTGAGFMDGRYWRVTEAEAVSIDSGEQGKNRIDLIGVRYAYDGGTGYETCSLEVVKGTAVTGTPSDPTYTDGNIEDGAPEAFFPLYRIKITGIVPAAPVKLFKTLGASVSCPWPVGAVLQMTKGTDPNSIYPGTTWQKIQGVFLLGSSSSHALGSTGGAETVTLATGNLPAHTHSVGAHSHGLNEHTHSVPAHAHGLNSHTHSVGAHSHGLNSHTHSVGAHSHGLNSHTHTYAKPNSPTGGTALTAAQLPKLSGSAKFRRMEYNSGNLFAEASGIFTTGSGTFDSSYDKVSQYNGGTTSAETLNVSFGGGSAHTHTIGTTSTNSGAASGSTANSSAFNTGAASGSTANSSAFNTGAASGNTANSAALTSGKASGNTANSTAFNSGSTGSGTAVNKMPPFKVVHMWERTA